MTQVLIFKLGKGIYALDVSEIIEIIKVQKINKVPKSDKRILGITDVRGKVSIVLDLQGILELNEEETPNFFIIVKKDNSDRQYIYPVTDVLNIESIEDNNYFKNANNIISSEYVESFIKDKDEHIIVLLNNQKILNEKNYIEILKNS